MKLIKQVLKRGYSNGFFPVTELNNVAENVLGDVKRIFGNKQISSENF